MLRYLPLISTLYLSFRFIFKNTHCVCVKTLVFIFCMAGTRGGFRAKGTGTIGGGPWCYRPPTKTRSGKDDVLPSPGWICQVFLETSTLSVAWSGRKAAEESGWPSELLFCVLQGLKFIVLPPLSLVSSLLVHLPSWGKCSCATRAPAASDLCCHDTWWQVHLLWL